MGMYIHSKLRQGEEIRYEAHLSLWSLLPSIITAMLVLLASAITLAYMNTDYGGISGVHVSTVLGVVGILMLLAGLSKYYTTEIAITNMRVIAKHGLIKRSTMEMLIEKVESLQVDQGFIGRLLNYGSLEVSGAGEANADIAGISNPLKFRDQYYDAEDERSKRRNQK